MNPADVYRIEQIHRSAYNSSANNSSASNSSANKRSNGSYYGNLSDFSSRQERYISISYIL